MSYLEVDRINSFYGDSHILFDVTMRVEKSEVVALFARNGAGKSTTLKPLIGLVSSGDSYSMKQATQNADREAGLAAAADLRDVPAPAAAPREPGHRSLRRRAADAGDRAGADPRPQDPAAR
jgi:ATPase subunit of ABC transporter with duplicated ATPase domains